MILGNEQNGKSEIEQTQIDRIPKLFTQNYEAYTNEILKLLLLDERVDEPTRFTNFSLSEKFFIYLKQGLKVSQETYEQRYKNIENSKYKRILNNPLLLIFKHRDFLDATIKTPELYFNTYLKIIYTQNIKSNKLVFSDNLDKKDLVYIYLRLNPDNFFGDICHRDNPLFDSLFESDLNSHLVDDVVELTNMKSYAFIEAVIKKQRGSGLLYIRDLKLKNGVNALAWFKAYMYYNQLETIGDYIKQGSLRKYRYFRESFIAHDIFQPNILGMFPGIVLTSALHPVNLSDKAREIINGTPQKNWKPQKRYSRKEGFLQNLGSGSAMNEITTTPIEESLRFVDTDGKDSQFSRTSSSLSEQELEPLRRERQGVTYPQYDGRSLESVKKQKLPSINSLMSSNSPIEPFHPSTDFNLVILKELESRSTQSLEAKIASQYTLSFLENACANLVKQPSLTPKKISFRSQPIGEYYYPGLIFFSGCALENDAVFSKGTETHKNDEAMPQNDKMTPE